MIEVFKINQHIIGLELNKKGLIRIFDDELLYKQFFEYAVKKRSVEYAVSISYISIIFFYLKKII